MKSLEGLITALITPFNDDTTIDFDAFKGIIEQQIENKVDGLVVCGSTGENATLTDKEKLSVFIQAVEYSAGRIPIIAGTGTYDTQKTIDMTILAKEHGCAAALVVAPYYTKPSQRGLYLHYKAVADSCDIPIIIYNIPGRSGVNIHAETQIRLAEECPNIIATKEASGDLEQVMQILKYAPEGFNVLSGDDALTLPMMAAGAKGTISVLSNYLPEDMKLLIDTLLENDIAQARDINKDLLELMQINFIETNPIPVKTVMAKLGMCKEVFRLPMIPMAEETKSLLMTSLLDNGVIDTI